MLKRILLPLENSPYSIAVIEYSCFIAKRQDAEVTGCIFIDIDKVDSSLGSLNPDLTIKWAKDIQNDIIGSVTRKLITEANRPLFIGI
ncbi:MAG TPA: hypothetical protein ENI61_00970 [Ignavibacteria bacterium]|nr:hypothetical protein [Ignavibacteria bacterium]